MLTAILLTIIAAIVQQVTAQVMSNAKLKALDAKIEDAKRHAMNASDDAASAYALLEPAVARLPKTRSRKPDDGQSAAGPGPGPYSDMGGSTDGAS